MSWFSDLTSKFNEDFTTKFNEKFNEVTEQAKSALHVNPEMIEKLTLTTPELAAERKRLEEEEKRKEYIKDCLAGLLPWQTRDPERDILVEECKEAIMKLSSDEASFKGPFLMPDMKVKLEDDKKKDGEEGDEDSDEEVEAEKKLEAMKPSKESLEKLSKLEPLPKLLQHFDLDAHVGLIERLLTEDPMLVKMQSKLSGGGEREHYFWKNYFVNCAFARYEAGLDIDEIWSEELTAPKAPKQSVAQGGTGPTEEAEEETITFDHNDGAADPTAVDTAFSDTDQKGEPTPAVTDNTTKTTATSSNAVTGADDSGKNTGSDDFERIEDDLGDDVGDADDDLFGGELDELEAEIARELED